MRGASRAVSPVAGSRPIGLVACGIARRRIACRRARRMRYRPSPDTAWGMVVACGIARRRIVCRMARHRIASRPGPARPSDLGVPAMFMVGRAEYPSPAMPRPNSACSRRRQPLCCEHIFACTPWRFMNARSAARLRRIVGPLSHHGSCRTNEPMTPLRHTVRKSPGSRT